MTQQEIFTKVKIHLLTQNEKSTDGKKCFYRGPNGLKCALGCLINDEFYSQEMECYEPIAQEKVNVALEKSGILEKLEFNSFLCELQIIHDLFDPKCWEGILKELAVKYNFKS